MILPIGDDPNPRGIPGVNWLLIGVNVAVFFWISWPMASSPADPSNPDTLRYLELVHRLTGEPLAQLLRTVSRYDVFIFTHGYRASDPAALDLLQAMFLHGNFVHLAGNMLFLWIYGDNVEHRLGHVLYLLVYLLLGVGASLAHGLLTSEPGVPSIGASGAISGVLGLYFVWFPRNVVRVLVFLFPFFMDVILVPARWVLGFYLVVENFLPMLLTREGSGVAYGAHLGGFVGGVGLAMLMRTISRQPNPSPRSTAAEYRRFIAAHPQGPGLAEAHLELGRMHLQNGQLATAYQYLLSALELSPSPQVERQAREGLGVIREIQLRRRRLV